MPRRTEVVSSVNPNTTVWPFQDNSCMACWNMPLTADDSQTAPRAHGTIASFPVHLTELDGKTSIVCYVARCVNCGHIQAYGDKNGIYKLKGGRADFNIGKWPEILRNNIDSLDFEEAVIHAKGWPIYLDARIGLKEPPLPKDVQKLWDNFWNRLGGFR